MGGLVKGLGAGSAVLAILGCGQANGGRDAAVRDSAGVRIVEQSAVALESVAPYRLEEPAALDVGGNDAPEYLLERVADAVRLDDGRIVVADGGASKLRVYDARGRFLETAGRAGDGPGEYRYISRIGRGSGDTLWVYDFGARRFTVLDGSFHAVRQVAAGIGLAAPLAVGSLDDGGFVLREAWSAEGDVTPGLHRDPVVVGSLAADGSRLDTLGLFPGREIWLASENGRAVMNRPLLAHDLSVAVQGGMVAVGDGASFEVRVRGGADAAETILRVTGMDLRASSADITRAKSALIDAAPEADRVGMRQHLEELPQPATRPAYGSLLIDTRGLVWVEEYTVADEPATWWVLDPARGVLGRVAMPHRFQPLRIGEDWVLGVARDDLDVEHVRVYTLARNPH